MAIYGTFLVASDRELAELFPGWAAPLPKAATRKRKHPFTGAAMEITTWEPEQLPAPPSPSFARRVASAFAPAKRASVTTVHGDYQAYLESRLDPRIRELPHVCTKGVLSTHLEDLYSALGGEETPPLRPALFSPRGDGRVLDRLPTDGVRLLAGRSREQIGILAKQLVTSGAFRENGWSASGLVDFLPGLQSLASKALLISKSLLLFVEV